jgi:hypothetical protein
MDHGMMMTMARHSGAMHVARIKSSHVDRQGQRRDYQSVYLRRSFRDGGKVKHEQLANLSALPEPAITAIEAVLAGHPLAPVDARFQVSRSLPHGHVAAVWAQATALGLPALLGPAGRDRDLVMALIVSRVIRPSSKLATTGWWADTTLGADLGLADAGTDEVYAAMDWLLARQDGIEAKLAARHLAPAANPARMALFDLSSSWVTGTHCPLAARGYSRDGKKGLPQIEYGLLTDPAGRPVAVRVFPGNTGDPTAFTDAVDTVRSKFGLQQMVMVGDRGMITAARIEALKKLGGLGWLTCLRAPAIATLAAADGPLQLTLFDEQDLAEITHPDYPGERLIACRNPALATDRARKRSELLAATETLLAPITAAVGAGRLTGADKIGYKLGRVIDKYKMAKHLHWTATDTSLTIERDQPRIDAEAALDGIYVIRTSVPADTLDPAAAVTAYKRLAHVERDFRCLKTIDLQLRPIHHRLEDRVRAHVLICMLAAYLLWHLRHAWAPLTYTDEHPTTTRQNPVAPARRSASADQKAARHRDQNDQPVRSFRGLLDHLATLTRNHIHIPDADTGFDQLTTPTDTQRQAFELLGAAIPTTLK